MRVEVYYTPTWCAESVDDYRRKAFILLEPTGLDEEIWVKDSKYLQISGNKLRSADDGESGKEANRIRDLVFDLKSDEEICIIGRDLSSCKAIEAAIKRLNDEDDTGLWYSLWSHPDWSVYKTLCAVFGIEVTNDDLKIREAVVKRRKASYERWHERKRRQYERKRKMIQRRQGASCILQSR